MTFEFFRDSDGSPRVKTDDAHSRAGSYLESDVQGSAACGKRLLAVIRELHCGARGRFEETGNAHTLTITPVRALITPELENAAPLSMDLAEFERLLSSWVSFLESR
jgi:hypothetical protein